MDKKYGIIPGVGFKRKTYKEMETDCIARAKTAWGNDWEPHETAGEWMIIKNLLFEIDLAHQNQQELFSFIDDENCTGYLLDARYKLIGLYRKLKTHSFVMCSLEGSPSSYIPSGLIVIDSENGNEYISVNDIFIDENGAALAQFKSIYKGSSTYVSPNTLTKLKVHNSDIISITNPLASTGGLDDETDDKFRGRKEQILQESESSCAPVIRNAILSLDIVSKAEVYENYTNEYISEFDLEPGEVRAIVQGPQDQNIAYAIFNSLAAGIGTAGLVQFEVSGDNAQTKMINYDIAKYKEIFIKVEVSDIYSNESLSEALIIQIKETILEYFNNLEIKERVSSTKLQSKITNNIKVIYDCQVFINTHNDFSNWIRYIDTNFDEISYTDINKIEVVEP